MDYKKDEEVKKEKKQPAKPVRRQPVKNINFTRRIDREAKKNG